MCETYFSNEMKEANMDHVLSQAYYGVYCSSKEIINSNQRHLFSNMLDLLTRTCKTTCIAGSKVISDEQVKFWLINILPLMFDEEQSIQQRAINALESGLKVLDVPHIHRCCYWSEIKAAIIETFATKVRSLCDARNPSWLKIWCILIRILDKEILSSTSTINIFLSIVEFGFRSRDYSVRAESLLCWRFLIEIFSNHKNICSAKHVRLICIPLKAPQTKNIAVEEVKHKVWWYLICKLDSMEPYFTTVVEPFFTSRFRGDANGGTIKINDTLKDMSLICLASILTETKNDFIRQRLAKFELEEHREHFLSVRDFKKHWQFIVDTVIEAIESIAIADKDDTNILDLLLRGVVSYAIRTNPAQICDYFLTKMGKLIPEHGERVAFILNSLGVIEIDGETLATIEERKGVLCAFVRFMVTAKSLVTNADLHTSVHNVLRTKLNGFHDHHQIMSSILKAFVDTAKANVDSKNMDVKVMIWKSASERVVALCSELAAQKSESLPIKDLWRPWIMRPLQEYCHHLDDDDDDGNDASQCFDENFCKTWKDLLSCHDQATFSVIFGDILDIFQQIMKKKGNITILAELFNIAVTSMAINYSEMAARKLIVFIKAIIMQCKEAERLSEPLRDILRNALHTIRDDDVVAFIDKIKATLRLLLKDSSSEYLSRPVLHDIKEIIIDKVRRSIDDENLLNDVLAIVPTSFASSTESKLNYEEEHKRKVTEDVDTTRKQTSTINTSEGVQDDDINEQETPSKNDSIRKVGYQGKVHLSEKQMNLLQKFNVQVKNVKDARRIIRTLEGLNINTVDGDEYLLGKSSRPKRWWSNGTNENEAKSEMKKSTQIAEEIRGDNLETPPSETNEEEEAHEKSPHEENVKKLKEQRSESKEYEEIFEVISKGQGDDKLLTSSLTEGEREREGEGELSRLDDCKAGKSEDVAPTSVGHVVSPDLEKAESGNIASTDVDCIEIATVMDPTVYPSAKEPLPKVSSPPRKILTKGAISPLILKPPSTAATCSHLTGRGAQLINMIRNKRCNLSPLQQLFSMNGKSPDSDLNRKSMKSPTENRGSHTDIAVVHATEEASPAQPTKDDMTLIGQMVPSPAASPSAGILKRKLRYDSCDDNLIGSPNLKRKRVSFHDPPVSTTREFDVYGDDEKTKRNTPLEKTNNDVLSTKYIPKCRKSLGDMTMGGMTDRLGKDLTAPGDIQVSAIEARILANNENNNNCLNAFSVKATASAEKNGLVFTQSSDALTHVVKEFPLDDILRAYTSEQHSMTATTAKSVAHLMSKAMKADDELKSIVLNFLSEDHANDFLRHSVQEHSSSAICERLNFNAIVNYVCAESKANACRRDQLISQIKDTLAKDVPLLVDVLLESCELSDESIFHLIGKLVAKRRTCDKSAAVTSQL